MMAYFCNGKKGICPTYEMDACGDYKYFDGSGGHKIAIQTNADHIRGMTDKELAKFIPNWSYTDACKCDEQPCVDCNNECDKCVLDWLQQPYKEDE